MATEMIARCSFCARPNTDVETLIGGPGVEVSWAQDADEKAAVEYHNGLDHSNLGHTHVAEKDERETALADS